MPTDLDHRLLSAIDGLQKGSSDFDLNPDVYPAGRKLRPAGVLLAIDVTGSEPRIILTKRASNLKHHPGQIAFPGGKVDEIDQNSPVRAALREAEEEVGLPQDSVRVLAALPNHETVTGFDISPVVAVVERSFVPVPETGEVEEVFSVPLRHVCDPANFQIESRIWQGHRRRYYTVPYGPYYIWGATARMLRMLADGMSTRS